MLRSKSANCQAGRGQFRAIETVPRELGTRAGSTLVPSPWDFCTVDGITLRTLRFGHREVQVLGAMRKNGERTALFVLALWHMNFVCPT